MNNITFEQKLEYIDLETLPPASNIKKKVFEDGVWVDAEFIFVVNNTPIFHEWLRKHYGPQQYSVTYWNTFRGMWLRDKIFVHWKLCE